MTKLDEQFYKFDKMHSRTFYNVIKDENPSCAPIQSENEIKNSV